MRYVLRAALILPTIHQPASALKKKIIKEGLKVIGGGAVGGTAGTVGGGTILNKVDRDSPRLQESVGLGFSVPISSNQRKPLYGLLRAYNGNYRNVLSGDECSEPLSTASQIQA